MTLHISEDSLIAGDIAEVWVQVKDLQGNPLSGASIKFHASGGTFLEFDRPQSYGISDSAGYFRARWLTGEDDGPYVIVAEATKPTHGRVFRRTKVSVDRKRDAVSSSLRFYPNPVLARERDTVEVQVFLEGRSLADAGVKLVTSGGYFLQQETGAAETIQTGRTDAEGRMTAVWQCDRCASFYPFMAEIRVRDSDPLTVRDTLWITYPKPPPVVPQSQALIRGTVRNCPEPDYFQVIASHTEHPKTRYVVRLDEEGAYALTLPPGPYLLRVSPITQSKTFPIVSPEGRTIQLEGGQTVNVNWRCE